MGITSLIRTQAHWHEYHVNKKVYFPLGYSIVGATIFTYMTLTWANKHAPASVVAAYSSLQPLTAALLSYFVWHVVPTENEYIGGAAIIVGLVFVTIARVIETRKEKLAYQPINSSPYGTDFVITSSPAISPSPSGSRKWGANEGRDIQRKSFGNSEIASSPPVNRR
jgi:hypothetical protein